MTAPANPGMAPVQDVSGQILLELGKMSAQIAVMNEKLSVLPDHETRIRALERFRYTLLGAVIVISGGVSALATWLAQNFHH